MPYKVNVTVKAFNKEGYTRDIVVANEQQVVMTDSRVKENIDGICITPADFPEAAYFAITIREYR